MNDHCPDWNNCPHEPRHQPLPPQGRDATNKGPYPDWDDDTHGDVEDYRRFTTRG